MTGTRNEPADKADRVDDVLSRATDLSDELQRTIAELTQMLRTEGEESTGGRS